MIIFDLTTAGNVIVVIAITVCYYTENELLDDGTDDKNWLRESNLEIAITIIDMKPYQR